MAKNAKVQKSVSDEVCDYIKKQKLLPIPVQALNEEVEATRYFGGDLKEFIVAAKSLGAKSIFVETLYLEEDEFFYDSGMDDEEYLETYSNDCCCGGNCQCGCCADKDEKKADKKSKKAAKVEEEEDGVWLEPEDLDGLDLTLLKPEMAKFMDRVGESCGVRLTVPGVDHLEVEIFADWYDEFAELVDEASEIIEDDPVGALEDMQAAFDEAEAAAEAAEKAALEAEKAKGTKKIAAHPPKKSK
ncbi:MAG: hypothetical protein MJY98_08395 [Fibrobacter sp.]|nr:hypothetical protein [Fibrobacter sp.]